MASIVPPARPAQGATDVPSPIRRASSHSSATNPSSLSKPSVTPSASTSATVPETNTTATMTTPSGAKLTSPSNSQTSASGSDLGGPPGAFPRDPHVALEHLNDKVEAISSQSNEEGGTILDAAREDLRHVADVASQFLPGTVVGALGSVLGTGATDADNIEKNPKIGEVRPVKVTFDPGNVAVGGIVSDFDPSSSKSRSAPSSVANGTRTSDNGPPSSTTDNKSTNVPDVGPTAVLASKEKRDDDVHGLAPKETQSSDLRKKAIIGTAAFGAGAGALGGAAYASHKTPPPEATSPSSKVNPQAKYMPSGAPTSSSGSVEEPIVGTPDSSKLSDQAQAKGTSPSVFDTRGRSEAQKALDHRQPVGTTVKSDEDRKKAVQAAALGAGIGTLGGATYAHAHQPAQSQDPQAGVSPTGTAQPQVGNDAKLKSTDVPAAGGKLAEDEPAFVSYAPAPVITEDYTPDIPEDEDEIPPTSSVRDEKSASLGTHAGAGDQKSAVLTDLSDDSKAEKFEGAALGAGAGVVGGAAYHHSRGTEKQKGDIGSDALPKPASRSLSPRASQSPANQDAKAGEVKAKKGVSEGAALGAGAGVLGGAAYAHSRRSEKDASEAVEPTAVPADKTKETPSPPSTASTDSQRQPQPAQKSIATTSAPESADAQKTSEQTDASDDSKVKRGAEGAALGAGAGLVGTSAYRHLHGTKEQDATSTSPASQAQAPSKPADASAGAGPAESHDPSPAPDDPKSSEVPAVATPPKEDKETDEVKESKGSNSDADSDKKGKKGFWAAALGAGAGVLGGAALKKSRRKSGEEFTEADAQPVFPRAAPEAASQPQQLQPQVRSKEVTTQSTSVARPGSKDTGRADGGKPSHGPGAKDAAVGAGIGAGTGAIGSTIASDTKSADDQQQTTKDVKTDEKGASASDTESAAPASGDEQMKGGEQSKELAVGAVGGTAARVGAGLAASQLRDDKKQQATVPSKESSESAAQTKAQSQQPVKGTKVVTKQSQQTDKPVQGDKTGLKTQDQSKNLAGSEVNGTSAGACTGLAANTLPSDTTQQPPSVSTGTQEKQAHPSIKAASNPPQRPGPIALGAAGPHDKPKSGADSDFPLPSANASSTDIAAKTADIDGSGKPSSTTDAKGKAGPNSRTANTAAGVVTAGAAGAGAGVGAGAATRDEGTDGPEEKDGGRRRSSATERKRNSRNSGEGSVGESARSGGSGNGSGNGHGKKEGFVKHLVEKVKDKLHHHEKAA